MFAEVGYTGFGGIDSIFILWGFCGEGKHRIVPKQHKSRLCRKIKWQKQQPNI
jgi:hypothetical protein